MRSPRPPASHERPRGGASRARSSDMESLPRSTSDVNRALHIEFRSRFTFLMDAKRLDQERSRSRALTPPQTFILCVERSEGETGRVETVTPYEQVTRDIRIRVFPEYSEEQSTPEESYY